MPVYNKINKPYISFNIKGPGSPGGVHNFGLGNILFQVATGISLAKDNNATLVLDQLSETKFGGYYNNVFSNIYTKYNPKIQYDGKYVQPNFSY